MLALIGSQWIVFWIRMPATFQVGVITLPYVAVLGLLNIAMLALPSLVVPLKYRRRRRLIDQYQVTVGPNSITVRDRPERERRIRREDVRGYSRMEHSIQVFSTGTTLDIWTTLEPEGLADVQQTLAAWVDMSQKQTAA
jgi:hypothetical protein